MKLKKLCEVYDQDTNINLSGRSYRIAKLELPADLPRKISGNFYCFDNQLTSLEHCPIEIGGNFDCSSNQLTTLEFCPSVIGGFFNCYLNRLTTLKDIHRHVKKIGGRFSGHDNRIKSHILGLMLIEIGGKIGTGLGDGKDVDEILNKWKNQGRKGVLGCQRELIDMGYEELAQL